MRHHTWVATAVISSAVIGGGVSMYGANKQAKAVQSATSENAALEQQKNDSAWAAYLMSRGINPMGATAGTIPTNAPAINAKLPLWATWTMPGTAASSSPRRLVRRTTPAIAPASTVTPGSKNWWNANARVAYALP